MRNLFIGTLILGLITGCNFFKKPDNSNPNGLASDTSGISARLPDLPIVSLDTVKINGKTCRLDSITKAEFDTLVESAADTNLPPEIKNVKEGLKIRLENGDSLFLRNVVHIDSESNEVRDDVQEYVFAANYLTTDYWLITISLYEGEVFLLVNKKNGKERGVIETPCLSPNRNFFASSHYDMSGENANGLDLCKIGSDSLVPVFSIEPAWGAEKVKWKDNNTLYLKQSSWDKTQHQIFRYAKLDLRGLKTE